MTSNMVAPGKNPFLRADPAVYPTAQHSLTDERNTLGSWQEAQHAVPPHLVLPRIRPRDGATTQSMLHEMALEKLCQRHLQMDYATLADRNPPAMPALPKNATRESERIYAERLSLVHDWQQKNTALFWAVLDSLDLSGLTLLSDNRFINTMQAGALADGRALVAWVRNHTGLGSHVHQSRIRVNMAKLKLKSHPTRADLSKHARTLLEMWASLNGSNRAEPLTYYHYLEQSFGDEASLSHVGLLRSMWLKPRIAELQAGGVNVLSNPDLGIDAMLKYAEEMGMPEGTIREQAQDLIMGLFTSCQECDDQETDTSLNVVDGDRQKAPSTRANDDKPKKSFKPEDNDCDMCSSWACQSKRRGGKGKCICRHDSKFDVSKLTKGNRNHVLMARKHHKANPDITSMKDMKFRVRRQGGDKPAGSIAPLISMCELNEAGDDDDESGDDWLDELEDSVGLFALGADPNEMLEVHATVNTDGNNDAANDTPGYAPFEAGSGAPDVAPPTTVVAELEQLLEKQSEQEAAIEQQQATIEMLNNKLAQMAKHVNTPASGKSIQFAAGSPDFVTSPDPKSNPALMLPEQVASSELYNIGSSGADAASEPSKDIKGRKGSTKSNSALMHMAKAQLEAAKAMVLREEGDSKKDSGCLSTFFHTSREKLAYAIERVITAILGPIELPPRWVMLLVAARMFAPTLAPAAKMAVTAIMAQLWHKAKSLSGQAAGMLWKAVNWLLDQLAKQWLLRVSRVTPPDGAAPATTRVEDVIDTVAPATSLRDGIAQAVTQAWRDANNTACSDNVSGFESNNPSDLEAANTATEGSLNLVALTNTQALRDALETVECQSCDSDDMNDSDDIDYADEYSLEELFNLQHHGHVRPAFEEDTVITDVMWARDHFEAQELLAPFVHARELLDASSLDTWLTDTQVMALNAAGQFDLNIDSEDESQEDDVEDEPVLCQDCEQVLWPVFLCVCDDAASIQTEDGSHEHGYHEYSFQGDCTVCGVYSSFTKPCLCTMCMVCETRLTPINMWCMCLESMDHTHLTETGREHLELLRGNAAPAVMMLGGDEADASQLDPDVYIVNYDSDTPYSCSDTTEDNEVRVDEDDRVIWRSRDRLAPPSRQGEPELPPLQGLHMIDSLPAEQDAVAALLALSDSDPIKVSFQSLIDGMRATGVRHDNVPRDALRDFAMRCGYVHLHDSTINVLMAMFAVHADPVKFPTHAAARLAFNVSHRSYFSTLKRISTSLGLQLTSANPRSGRGSGSRKARATDKVQVRVQIGIDTLSSGAATVRVSLSLVPQRETGGTSSSLMMIGDALSDEMQLRASIYEDTAYVLASDVCNTIAKDGAKGLMHYKAVLMTLRACCTDMREAVNKEGCLAYHGNVGGFILSRRARQQQQVMVLSH